MNFNMQVLNFVQLCSLANFITVLRPVIRDKKSNDSVKLYLGKSIRAELIRFLVIIFFTMIRV